MEPFINRKIALIRVGNIFKLKHLTCKHDEKAAIILTVILMIALSLTAFHTYFELPSTPSEYMAPLAFPNETPGLFYVRYFTNASRVLVLFENRENAEKFASFIQNNSVVITSDGTHADVLMKRNVLTKILELADYSDVTRLPADGYWNPQRLEKEYNDLDFLLTNYSFPEPIRSYLLDRFRERSEDMERMERAKNFMLAHRGLEFYEIELIEPSYSMGYPDLSSDLAVILLAEIALIALAVFERDRKMRAVFLIAFLFLMIPAYQFAMYERDLSMHEKTLDYITKMPEKSFNWTFYEGLNGSVEISCYVSKPDEIENLLAAVNSSKTGIKHSLKGMWLHVIFVDENPQRFLLFEGCSLGSYGYSCHKHPTREELQIINKTKRLLEKIPQDKRYLVKDALSRYNLTISSCDEGSNLKGLPLGKYMIGLYVFPKTLPLPDLQLILQMMISAVVILFLVLLLEGEKQ